MIATACRPPRSDNWYRVVVAVFGLLGAALVLVVTSRHGVGLSPDSAYYLSAARSLAAGNGWTTFEGLPLTTWPPLFSTLLALPTALGVNTFLAARVMNALACGGAITVAGLLFRHTFQSRLLAVLATAALISTPLVSVSIMAWTEPVFVLLALLLALLLIRYMAEPRTPRLIALCTVAALACLQRYAGVALPVAGAALLLTWHNGPPRPCRIRRAAIFLGASLLPLGAWLVRNLALTGTLTGPRAIVPAALGPNIKELFSVLAEFVLPEQLLFSWVWLVTLVAVAGLAILSRRVARRDPGPEATAKHVATTTLIVYLAALVLALTPDAWDQVDRLLVPAYPFLLILLLGNLEPLSRSIARRTGRVRLGTVVTLAVTALWLILPIAVLGRTFRSWMRDGVGVYDTAEWRESQLIDWVRHHPLQGQVYSNDPAGLYLLTGTPARMSLRRDRPIADQLAVNPIRPGDHLVWFRRINRSYLFTVPELAERFELEETAFTGDGGVLVFR